MNNLTTKKLILGVSICLLNACVSHPSMWKKETNQRIQNEVKKSTMTESLAKSGVPSNISQALIPSLRFNLPKAGKSTINQKFNVSVNNINAKDMYMNLVKGTPISVMVDDSVTGKVALSLKNVTIDEVFDYMEKVYGYSYEKKNSQYIVYGKVLRSKIFHVDYLSMLRKGTSRSDITSGGLSTSSGNSGVNIESKNDVKFWDNLLDSLTILVGTEEGKKVVVNQHSGYIVINAWPSEIRVVEEYLQGLQASITRQVVLEAKLLEIELNDGFEMGINWGTLLSKGSTSVSAAQTGGGGSFVGSNLIADPVGSIGSTAFGGVFGVALQSNKFGAFIEAIRTQGDVHVLSSPRIAAVNNQKAIIKVGGEEYYVTGIQQGQTTTNADGTVNKTPSSISLESFFSGIALDVTPQIDKDNNIILHLHPTVSEVLQKSKTFTVGGDGFDIPLAASTVRETDTVVRAKSGQIIVVGGLMKESTVDEESAVPILGEIPFLGNLFKHKKVVRVKKELVVLVKPTLVNNGGQWSRQAGMNAKRFSSMKH